MNWKAMTKSLKLKIGGFGARGTKTHTFTAGGRKRVVQCDSWEEGRMVYVNGEIRMADGTKAYAILIFDELSSGEHWGTGIWTPSRVVDGKLIRASFYFDDEPDFLAKIGKTKEQVYPYRYKYSAQLDCHDHHIGDDGWSR